MTRETRGQLRRFLDHVPLANSLGRSVLELSAVRPATLHDYLKRLSWFRQYLLEHGQGLTSDADLDDRIVTWFDMLFSHGHEAGDGSKFLAALQHLWPHLRGSHCLPRSWRAIRGWKKLRPLRSRVPLPWVAVLCIVGAMLWLDAREEAFAILLMFLCYLRPVDLFNLRRSSLVPPASSVTGMGHHWALLLAPMELTNRPNKSGEFDESVRMDIDELEWMNDIFVELRADGSSEPVWSFLNVHLTSMLRDPAALSGVSHLRPQLYSLRHGGASHDALTRRRPLSEIKKRGRWASDQTVRRYEKAALAQREANRLSHASDAYGTWVATHLRELFTNEVIAKAPPESLPPQLT